MSVLKLVYQNSRYMFLPFKALSWLPNESKYTHNMSQRPPTYNLISVQSYIRPLHLYENVEKSVQNTASSGTPL